MDEKIKIFKDLFNKPEEKCLIFIGSPDPDSIGSALGMQLLIFHINKSTADIVYKNEISHPQNRTLVNVLGVEMKEESKFFNEEENIAEYSKFIFVDHIPPNNLMEDIKPTIVIDHHKNSYAKEGVYVDIRGVGSCSAIIWEYLSLIGYKFSPDKETDSRVAIAMLFGIKTDTGDLISEGTTELDFRAYQDLSVIVKENNISDIINYKYPAYFFEIRSRLDEKNNSLIKDSFFIGGIEFISPARRDCLPILADERVRMEGISTSVVFAIVENNLEVSIRSSNPAVDVNKLCKDVFGEDYGGGRTGAGAAKVPLGILSPNNMGNVSEEDKKAIWHSYKTIITHKILNYCVGH